MVWLTENIFIVWDCGPCLYYFFLGIQTANLNFNFMFIRRINYNHLYGIKIHF